MADAPGVAGYSAIAPGRTADWNLGLASFPVHAAIHDNSTIVAFCYEQGIEGMFDLNDPETFARTWNHLSERKIRSRRKIRPRSY